MKYYKGALMDKLDKAADIAQFISLMLLLNDATNNDLMRELQHQNQEYFEEIIRNQREILSLLKGKEDDV